MKRQSSSESYVSLGVKVEVTSVQSLQEYGEFQRRSRQLTRMARNRPKRTGRFRSYGLLPETIFLLQRCIIFRGRYTARAQTK